MDPELAFEYDTPNSIFFERETLVFSLFYIHKFESKTQIHNKLQELVKYLQFELQPYIDHYPWHHRPIEFKLVENRGYLYIYGELIYGDYLNDLWLITKILHGFSSRDKNIYIRIFDQDGEFLLIEGFDSLDEWLDPNSGTNRIWINDLKFKIIGNEYKKDKGLSLEDTLQYLINSSFSLEIPNNLNDRLEAKLKLFPTECLENIFVENIRVSKSLFNIISSKPDYLVNSALNYMMRQDSLFNVSGDKMKLTVLSSDCFPSDDDEVLNVRVSAFAHLYLKQAGEKYKADSELGKGKLVTLSIDSYLDFENETIINNNSVKTIEEYNQINKEDRLQTKLIRILSIPHKVASKNIEESIIKENDKEFKIDDFKKDKIMEKLKGFMNSKSDIKGAKTSNKEFLYDSDNYNDDSDYSSDEEDIKFDKAMKENLKDGDIDEDDFFEFFCKEALHLKDEEIADYRGFKEKTENNIKNTNFEEEDEVYSGLGNHMPNDKDEKDMIDIDVITNLLQSLHSEGGLTGPSASLLTQLGIDINDLMKERL